MRLRIMSRSFQRVSVQEDYGKPRPTPVQLIAPLPWLAPCGLLFWGLEPIGRPMMRTRVCRRKMVTWRPWGLDGTTKVKSTPAFRRMGCCSAGRAAGPGLRDLSAAATWFSHRGRDTHCNSSFFELRSVPLATNASPSPALGPPRLPRSRRRCRRSPAHPPIRHSSHVAFAGAQLLSPLERSTCVVRTRNASRKPLEGPPQAAFRQAGNVDVPQPIRRYGIARSRLRWCPAAEPTRASGHERTRRSTRVIEMRLFRGICGCIAARAASFWRREAPQESEQQSLVEECARRLSEVCRLLTSFHPSGPFAPLVPRCAGVSPDG